MSDTVYTPQVVLPMLRKVFPSMMAYGNDPNEQYPLWEGLVKEIAGWNFLSRRRLKMQIPNWLLDACTASIHKVIFTDGVPTHFTIRRFWMMDDAQREQFMMELANVADLHGIIKLKRGMIWVRQTTDPRQLNIDPRVMDGLMEQIRKECGIVIKRVNTTLTLPIDLRNIGLNATEHNLKIVT